MPHRNPTAHHRRGSRAALAAVASALAICPVLSSAQSSPGAGFTIEQITSYPYPSELAVATTGSRLAWVFNESGVRNIYAAEGPDFQPRQLL